MRGIRGAERRGAVKVRKVQFSTIHLLCTPVHLPPGLLLGIPARPRSISRQYGCIGFRLLDSILCGIGRRRVF